MVMLKRIGVAALAVSLAACAGVGVKDVRRMGQRGEVAQLMDAWDQAEKNNVRAAVIEAFSINPSADPGRRLVLSQGLSHADKGVRLAAVRALKAYEGEDITKALIGALMDPFPEVREVAQVTLADKIKKTEVATMVMEAAKANANHLVRAAALKLLCARAKVDSGAAPLLQPVLIKSAQSDSAPKVRAQAAKGLGELQLQAGRAVLSELAKGDADSSVRQAAQRALSMLGAPSAENAVVVAVLPLKDKTKKGTGGFAEQIAEYLAAKLSGAKVCQVVDREKLENALSELRKMGKEVYDGDAPNAPEIGSFKLANQLVYGSISKQGLVYTIVLNRMDVSTLELVPGAAVTVSGYKADLDQLKVQLADRFIANFR